MTVIKAHNEIIPIGGAIPDAPDPRRYSYGSVFGVDSYPRRFVREIPPINIPYQGQIPSCVPCTKTYLNEYNSYINDGENLNLSWRLPFAKTGPYNQGRNLEDVAKYMQGQGQPQDKFCEDNVKLSENEFMNPVMTIEGTEDAQKRIIGPHWWLRADNIAEICSALFNGPPLSATLGGISSDWTKPYDQIIVNTNGADWYHNFVIWDYDLDAGYYRIINWWGDGLRKLSINYPLTSVLSFADVPDTKNMFKVLKTIDKQDNWLISGNTRFRIPDIDTFHFFKGKLGVINDPIVVSQEELDKYIIDEMLPSVMLTRTLEPISKDIYKLE